MQFTTLSQGQARQIVGGASVNFGPTPKSAYIYKCWDTDGDVYWTDVPNDKGCYNSKTGQTEKGSAKQRKG